MARLPQDKRLLLLLPAVCLLAGVILIAVRKYSSSLEIPGKQAHSQPEIGTSNDHRVTSIPIQDSKTTGPQGAPSSQEKSKESFAAKAAAHQERLLKILNRLYFSEEGADVRSFSETKKHDARLKEFTEELEAAGESSILGTVML